MSASRPRERARVGYVLKKYPRISETFVVDEILAVEAVGVDVEIVSLRAPDDGRFHEDLSRVAATATYLADTSSSWLEAVKGLVAVEPAALAEAVAFIDLLPQQRRAGVLLQGMHLAAFARERRLDHLHAHFMTVAAHTVCVAHLLTGIPFTVTAHAKDVYRTTVDPVVWQAVAHQARAVVTVCDANERHIRERLLPPGHGTVVRIYNGVPIERLPRPATTPGDECLVLAVGRLVEKKGFDVLLDACALLAARGTEFRCLVVGDGNERDRLEARCRELDLGAHVAFTGALTRDRVQALMRSARLLAAPFVVGTDGNRDALPTVLLEALAAGLPVVATPVGGVAEIVRHERDGLLVPEGDASALAHGIERTLTDDRFAAHCATSGRARVHERFDRARTVRTLVDLFTPAPSVTTVDVEDRDQTPLARATGGS